jgi:hypothetical protein
MSSSGQYCIASSNDGGMYYSDSYGVTWNPSSETGSDWVMCAISFSGQYCVATKGNSGIFYSNDYGRTWTQSSKTDGLFNILITADGKNAIASDWYNRFFYYSTDYGKNWINYSYATNPPTGSNNGSYLGMSSDGVYITLGSMNGIWLQQNPFINNMYTSISKPLILNSAVVISGLTVYKTTPVTLVTPVSQTIFVSADTATVTMPTMTTSLGGSQITIRKTGSALGTVLTINAPLSANIFYSLNSNTLSTSISIDIGFATAVLISDGTYWYLISQQ